MSSQIATRDDDDHSSPNEDSDDRNSSPSALLLDGVLEPESVESLTTSQAWNLYTSHFLSTWNIRTYEFAAIIFTAAAYPDTLTAAAVRGIVRTLASICFSSSVGRWVDRSPKRLKTLMHSVSVNRVTVIAACGAWFFIVQYRSDNADNMTFHSLERNASVSTVTKHLLFAVILLLGIGENLSASGNLISMERDWIPAIANPAGHSYDLTHLNSIMRRIDLICKLIAPLFISFIISRTSTSIGVFTVGIMSTLSWGIEILSARYVYNRNPALQQSKTLNSPSSSFNSSGVWSSLGNGLRQYVEEIKNYFGTSVWIPSVSLSLLHLSALSYGATFMTFLLSAGFDLDTITLARAMGSVFEISSTVVTPFGVRVLGSACKFNRGIAGNLNEVESLRSSNELLMHGEEVEDEIAESVEKKTVTGLERLGLWGLCWQLGNLIPVVLILWNLQSTPSSPHLLARTSTPTLTSTILLFTTLSLSRLGLWIFDLTTSQLTQTLVSPKSRASFTGVEMSFAALFELLQHILVLVFARPEEFKWVACVSITAVVVSAVVYAAWVRGQRGHLVHWERWRRCVKREGV